MFRLTIIACLLYFGAVANANWYDNAVVYQVYPRSFKDSNGDGIGDLNGITSKLEHIADIGAQVVWLSPIYTSPQVDFGYDIANFTDVDPSYGTLADFDRLIAKAKSLGLKVILDFVPNHSSHEHPWFKKSIQRIKPYDEYYVWRDAKIVNGTRQPPNNWLSNFQGSAWEWNDVRKQYYLHAFAVGQPDLNYRSALLNQEIKNALTFWLNRGVSGFRIDVINHLFEDAGFRDEPSANRTDIPKDDYDSLIHIYTQNLHESYLVLQSWRELLDNFTSKTNTDHKLLLTETYAAQNYTIKYYSYGSIPFNFMFIVNLNNQSTAADFATKINDWIDAIPSGHVADWVVDNHDNHRVAARFGTKRADQITMLSMMLPGISVVYYGDEIGMEDRFFTYEETVDTAGCNAGPERYYLKSRDPARTPFQWDNTTSAGFSTSPKTWLPVNSNYKTLNLAAQKVAEVSHYKVFKAMVALKNSSVLTKGSAEVSVLKNKVLAVVRQLGRKYALLLTNVSNLPVTVNIKTTLDLPNDTILQVYTASIGSDISPGSLVFGNAVTVPGSASIVVIAA
ncbi:maltase 1-like [Ceratina calcarata]|uniref:alpha-glucosidase n=3 Tax=Ceratina calcarata TaxID=156304 RepID=A0AAJ7J5Q5_9HYME|nr:maltase 1-like [Ceratina calcarata]